MASMNSWMPLMLRSLATPDTAAAQEDTGAIMQMGAAVESMMNASLARDTFLPSVIGRMTEPTVRQLK